MIRKLEQKFKSKILLFGEYALMLNSKALSIPFEDFGGQLTFSPQHLSKEESIQSNSHLEKYCLYLEELIISNDLPCAIDIERFKEDVKNGLIFDSSIPQGSGLGSSGALIATVYNYYGIDNISNENPDKKEMQLLKKIFAKLESYFHGKSSGLDPLICYLRKAILVQDSSNVGAVNYPNSSSSSKEGAIFLIDTGQVGETQKLVNVFLEKCKNQGYVSGIKNEFIDYNNKCIRALLKGDIDDLFQNLKNLTKFTLNNFAPMIPSEFVQIWQKGISTNKYYLKLCGSGGGGFILGFTENLDEAKKELENYDLRIIQRL
jgi:mevalonate kinase